MGARDPASFKGQLLLSKALSVERSSERLSLPGTPGRIWGPWPLGHFPHSSSDAPFLNSQNLARLAPRPATGENTS